MDALKRWILKLIDSDRHGGRTLSTDDTTVVLYDCGVWSDAHTHHQQTGGLLFHIIFIFPYYTY